MLSHSFHMPIEIGKVNSIPNSNILYHTENKNFKFNYFDVLNDQFNTKTKKTYLNCNCLIQMLSS